MIRVFILISLAVFTASIKSIDRDAILDQLLAESRKDVENFSTNPLVDTDQYINKNEKKNDKPNYLKKEPQNHEPLISAVDLSKKLEQSKVKPAKEQVPAAKKIQRKNLPENDDDSGEQKRDDLQLAKDFTNCMESLTPREVNSIGPLNIVDKIRDGYILARQIIYYHYNYHSISRITSDQRRALKRYDQLCQLKRAQVWQG